MLITVALILFCDFSLFLLLLPYLCECCRATGGVKDRYIGMSHTLYKQICPHSQHVPNYEAKRVLQEDMAQDPSDTQQHIWHNVYKATASHDEPHRLTER